MEVTLREFEKNLGRIGFEAKTSAVEVDDAEADVKTTRKEMEDTLRALIDPRACA